MKRIVFRFSVLGTIVGLGLLAIAHAQRAATDPPPDDGANPLRNGQPQPVVNRAPANYPNDAVGPVDTNVPQGDNPLRRHISDDSVRPASNEEPQQGQGPTRIRLAIDGPPAGGNAANPESAIRVPAGEPQLMPPAADRFAMPARGRRPESDPSAAPGDALGTPPAGPRGPR